MEVEVNLEELNKQRIEMMKKNGKYSEISIFLEEGENNPITKLSFNGVSNETIGKNILILKKVYNYLEKQYPIASIMSKHMDAEIIN